MTHSVETFGTIREATDVMSWNSIPLISVLENDRDERFLLLFVEDDAERVCYLVAKLSGEKEHAVLSGACDMRSAFDDGAWSILGSDDAFIELVSSGDGSDFVSISFMTREEIPESWLPLTGARLITGHRTK